MAPRHVIKTRVSANAVKNIAEKYGMVYFGYVDPNDDSHRLVRGFTLSPTQIDYNYAMGTVQGYTTAFCCRNDIVLTRVGREKRCHRFIISVDLTASTALPHFYVGSQKINELFDASCPKLHALSLGNLAHYPADFTSQYAVYAQPGDVLEIERLFPPMTAATIVSHFNNTAFEVSGNTLYVYSENRYPTGASVDKMLQNAIWLAKTLDAVAHARAVLDE